MFRILVISLVSLFSVVPFLVLFNRILPIGNDLAGAVSIFLSLVVTPIVLQKIWKTKFEPSEVYFEDLEEENENYGPMESYPFSKVELTDNETVVWTGCNPTFHRGGEWGIIITDKAVYYFSPFWSIYTKWKRYPISAIEKVEFKDSNRYPMLALYIEGKIVKLRTPYDQYKDEMDFDREKLRKGLGILTEVLKMPNKRLQLDNL